MKRMFFLILFIYSQQGAAEFRSEIEADACASPQDCVWKLSTLVDHTQSAIAIPSIMEEAVLKRLLMFEDEAMPHIFGLLASDDEYLVRYAVVALSEKKQIDPKYLGQIVKGMERGISGLSAALGRVKTPEAAEIAMKAFLASDDVTASDEFAALFLLGETIVPNYLAAMNCEYHCNDETYHRLTKATGNLSPSVKSRLAAELMALVSSSEISIEKRRAILGVMVALGTAANFLEHDLAKVGDDEPLLWDQVGEVLISIESDLAVEFFVKKLVSNPSVDLIEKASALGIKAQPLGVALLALTKHEDLATRIASVTALGKIKFIPAVGLLLTYARNTDDLPTARAAVISLGAMQAIAAREEIEEILDTHWYPPIVDAAGRALHAINSGGSETFVDDSEEVSLPFRFFSDGEYFIMARCLAVVGQPIQDDKRLKRHGEKTEGGLPEFEYTYEKVSTVFEAPDTESENLIRVKALDDGRFELRESVRIVPSVALKAGEGWFLGAGQDGRSGSLVYLSHAGETSVLLEENIFDLYQLGDRYIAIANYIQPGVAAGMIYELRQNSKAQWTGELWKLIPGVVEEASMLEDGELLIHTATGGSLLLNEQGRLRLAQCGEAAV